MTEHFKITTMKNIFRYLFLTLFIIGFSKNNYADKWPVLKSQKSETSTNAEACLPASTSTDLNVNNVRARINTGGDMWWDLQGSPEYFIPGNTTKTSMFSAALWIGGLDVNGQLKLAAQRYRGNGNDFWTGPLTKDGTASVEAEVCDYYDKHFVITRAEVEEFMAACASNGGTPPSSYVIPECVKNYPAHPYFTSSVHSHFLAPFMDVDGDLEYVPENGDYPYYDFDNVLCPINYGTGYVAPKTMEGNGILSDQVLKGDMTLWWVFNDKGNIHTETKGQAVGMEIRAQAFGFSTNDEINNMTFYTYEIINRSTYRLTETYFSQWVDTDLGDATDDYIGCDVLRGLGYCYNGDDIDGTGRPQDYGLQPPAVGVDFFQGPYIDADQMDNPAYDINNPLVNCNNAINGVNFGNGIVDDERFGMRRFVYHNNIGGLDAITDPDVAPEYYNFLRGIWKDNERMSYWGNGHPSAGGNGPACDFMFPGDTDPCMWGTGGVAPGAPYPTNYWTEQQAGNIPDDRRFMQSAGPFTLEPGAVNYITVGIPWARATAGGAWESVELLRTVDDKCQALFDNCFKVLDGPDSPDLTVQELDRELVLYISNRKGLSNNYNNNPEDYIEKDNSIIVGDPYYRFEGYQIFQLADASVSITDLHDPDKARLVAQCDVKNDISKIVNYNLSEALGGNVPVMEVNGANTGIVHSFRILEDQFASGDKRLVNHKKYYYIAIAYAYNNYKTYSQSNSTDYDGQKHPYKAGRKAAAGQNVAITAMPHIPSPEAGGTIQHSEYGVMPQITRLEGRGNGGFALDFTTETHDKIMDGSPYFEPNLTYDYNKGPLNIKVIDPLNVTPGNFTLSFIPSASGNIDSATWVLTNTATGQTWNSESTITIGYEQLLMDLGLSIKIEQVRYVDPEKTILGYENQVIEATIEFADSSKKWLTGVEDLDNYKPFNWIRSGNTVDQNDASLNDYEVKSSGGSIVGDAYDPDENFEKILGGTWAPYRMSSKYEYGPALSDAVVMARNKLVNLYSIDLYLTPDRSKWTRCPVLEMCENEGSIASPLTEGNIKKFGLRAGQTDGEVGMGWFPGYAINVETGERLNMMFGEDSWLQSENGRDMIWNPTYKYQSPLGDVLMGGKHWTYIMGHKGDSYNSTYNTVMECPPYDGGAWLKSMFNLSTSLNQEMFKRWIFEDVMWVGCPLVVEKFQFSDPANMPCEVKIRIRVSRPYQRFYSSPNTGPAAPQNNNYPMYSFNTENIGTTFGNAMAAKGSLDLINVVPNPYYAFSGYETTQLDNRVRVTNLPQKCVISIYTVSGTLVRQYSKDDANSYVDWDLKNYAGIPIAGGLYLVHVKVDGVGEKVVKWFGSLRPIDLNAF